MKKFSKIAIAIILIITFIIIPQISFATEKGGGTLEKHTAKDDYSNILGWNMGVQQQLPDTIPETVGVILRILRNIAIILTVLVITILGIRYMISSVEKKAEYKKLFINIIIGAVVVSTITVIVDVIFSAAQNSADTSVANQISISNAIDSAKAFLNNGKTLINNQKFTTVNYKNAYDVLNFLYTVSTIIAVIVSIIVGTIIGIRIIWGGLDERADAKQLLVPYLTIVAFAAFALTLFKIGLTLAFN